LAQKRTPGLFKRGEVWHVDKGVRGYRIRESTGTSDLTEAERYLAFRTEQIRQAEIYGVRPERIFRQAATRYLDEETKASIGREAKALKILDKFIGDLPLTKIHMGTLQSYIADRRKAGNKARTINYGLQVVRRILNLASGEWIDEFGLTWLVSAPKIKLLRELDRAEAYPLSWTEQERLFRELPSHLRSMALFKVNTGTRDQEVCSLRWDWEVEIPELETSVFIIPRERVKNRQDRLVVLNRIAFSVVNDMRGIHPTHVFSYRGKTVKRMRSHGWLDAREKAGLPHIRVHDLKHTFGRRLRSAGVSFEDRQDLLGHRSSRITTHYSRAELVNLINAANTVCDQNPHKFPTLVVLQRKPRLAVVTN